MDTDDSSKPIAKPKRRWLGRTWRGFKWLVLAILVLGVVYVVWTNHRGTQARQRIAYELQQRNIPASLDEWREQAQDKIPDVENGARFYKAAFDLLTFFAQYADLPFVGFLDEPEPCEQVHPELLTRIKAALDENNEAFHLIDKAGERRNFDYNMQLNHFASPDGHILPDIRRVAHWLEIKGLYAQSIGDVDSAVDACMAVMQLNDSLKHEPYLITSVVITSVDALTKDMIVNMLSRVELSPKQMTQLKQHLDERISTVNLLSVLKSEIAFANEYLQNFQLYAAEQEYFRQQFLAEQAKHPWFDLSDLIGEIPSLIGSAICPGRYELDLASDLDQQIADHEALESINDDYEAMLQYADEMGESPLELDSTIRTWIAGQTYLQVILTAMEVELYRMQNGDWPQKLADLDTSVDPDPFSGEALKYRRTEDGVVVYSVGRDRHDNGGSEDIDENREYDIAFRLYDPAIRNSKPPVDRSLDDEDEWEEPRLESDDESE